MAYIILHENHFGARCRDGQNSKLLWLIVLLITEERDLVLTEIFPMF
jgi:hypothetical protein